MRNFIRLALIMAAASLAACGGGDTPFKGTASTSGSSGTGSTGTGSTGSTTTATAAALAAQTSASSIPADGSSTATITILALNADNNLIADVPVTLKASSGGALAVTGTGTTDSSGAVTATLSALSDAQPGTPITVTATSGSLTATVKVQVASGSTATTTAVSTLTLSSSAPSILTDGSTSATISALARDAANNVLAGVPVAFSATSGALQVTAATTDATGTATATLTAGGDSTARTITVTGSTAALTSTVQVQAVAPATPTAPVYSMGNGSGTTFTSGAIGVSTTGQLAAGGTTGLQISIVDQTNTLYTGGPVTVTFNSPCIASQNAGILVAGTTTPVTTVTTTTGSVNVTYEALGCSGSDIVTASATVATQALSATATLSIATAAVGSIQFVSATPTTIGLKGTGLGETSTVIFKVTDSTGGASSGVTVNFALNTTVGGLSLSPTSATSASDGTVQTVVSAGTVHTVVRVTASIASPALSTQSSQLTVTTGLPASAAFSIAVGAAKYATASNTLACPNVEGWGIDGVTVPVTVRLADRYNNPVPDGTAVAFYTTGGHIDGSCTTPLATSGDGTCQVTWTSANPRPALDSDSPALQRAGRATVLATTIGEESFTDINGTGFWQTGDPFANLGEPYADANENGVHDADEYYLDFNQNHMYDGPPNPAAFVGITCTGTTAGSTCTTQTLAIGAPHLIIMSTSQATPTLTSASGFTNSGSAAFPNLSTAGGGTLVINVQDDNGNSMAAGTTVSYSVAPSALGTATAIGPVAVGCNADVGGDNFEVQFAPPTSPTVTSGTLTVSITSPNGTTTAFVIPINIT